MAGSNRSQLPEKPAIDGLEAKWAPAWEAQGTYRFDRSKSRPEVYSIDTPPPTVSGGLHPGHVFSYTHTDLVARYQRMKGKEVFYPMGWDDNGLNVERRVQLLTGTIVDSSLPYDPEFSPPSVLPKRPVPVSRANFLELCRQIVPALEESYRDLWTRLGLSVDWSHNYTTIGEHPTMVSQRAFLRLVARDLAYRAAAPTLWDVDMKTAVAQAELADREVASAYHRLVFTGPGGERLLVDTTRPELLPACVALVANPGDERYRSLFGKNATTPLFGVSVPILAHELGDPEKGTGIAMVCTFGDTTDVTWWRELGLELRVLVQRDGTMRPQSWGEPGYESADPGRANRAYEPMVGRSTKQARELIVTSLTEASLVEGEPKAISHPVKFWENGNRPLEIVTSDQWFIRYPDQEQMLMRGKELNWWPDFMRVRYENWVNGLIGDWNITRQRFFGVPFPVWYPIDSEGQVDLLAPILAPEEMLPVDPTVQAPPGYPESARNQPGGFAPDVDVMDTWATSSLSPQIVCGWEDDPDLFARTYPMDLRPQAHDIIRTWMFTSIVRAHYQFDALPWANAAISGFVVDPDRKKLSKSADNAAANPLNMLERFGPDAVRYWAAQGRLGVDMTFDEGQLKIGRRLATKVLNASRFVLALGDEGNYPPTEPIDRALLAALAGLVDSASLDFERYDSARVIERVEAFFWPFCDDYLELVKGRAYREDGGQATASARATLLVALETLLKLFAPFLPYVTEEVWSWFREGSIHRSSWPVSEPIRQLAGSHPDAKNPDSSLLEPAGAALSLIRKAKTSAQLSMKAEVAGVIIRGTEATLDQLRLVESDLANAGVVTGEMSYQVADDFDVVVTLA